MEVALAVLRDHPEIVLFATIALGHALGSIPLYGQRMGLVGGSLIASLLVGQIGIEVHPQVRQIFLMLYLFAAGYGAGPQFFRVLRGDGIKPLILTLTVCGTGLCMVWLASRLMGLGPGFSAGLLSGSMTQMSSMGTAVEAIMGLDVPLADRRQMANHVPVANAVCYLLGFWSEMLWIAVFLPRLLRLNIVRAARELEAELGIGGEASGYCAQAIRTFRLASTPPVSVGAWEAEAEALGNRMFILRYRRDGQIHDATAETLLTAGDIIAVSGHRAEILDRANGLGEEVDDPDLLASQVEARRAIVTRRQVDGLTLEAFAALPLARGVFLTRLVRGGQDMPLMPGTRLERGDELTLIGDAPRLAAMGSHLGWHEQPTMVTNMLTLGLGVAVGCLIGLPEVGLFGTQLGLSTSVGCLVAGLLFGWHHSVRPMTLGSIPDATQSFLVSFGLAGFVSISGLHAGPELLPALHAMGLPLVIAGVVCNGVAVLAGVLVGRYVLRLRPLMLLAAVSGAITTSGAIFALQERSGSRAVMLGFTVPYALGTMLLTMSGTMIVLMTAG